MKGDLLRLDVGLLLARYGINAVLRELARAEQVPLEHLESTIQNIRHKKSPKVSRPIPTASNVVASLALPAGDKREILYTLAQCYDNKTFLPAIRDVKMFLDRLHVKPRSLKTRATASRKLFQTLASLPLEELERMTADTRQRGSSEFSELADEIIGNRKIVPPE